MKNENEIIKNFERNRKKSSKISTKQNQLSSLALLKQEAQEMEKNENSIRWQSIKSKNTPNFI